MTELQIKALLIKYFIEKNEDFIVGSEVTFQFGERRADLALLQNENLTAFEIKSSRDKLSRLSYQIESYKSFFDFCFIVCEKENISEVRAIAPKEIGILLVNNECIIQIRKSKKFKRHNKMTLISAINVNHLRTLSNNKKLRSKHELCTLISKNHSLEKLRELSRKDFKEKYEPLSNLMKKEIKKHINPDDIYTITKISPSHLKKKSLS